MTISSTSHRSPWLLPGDYVMLILVLLIVITSYSVFWSGQQRIALAEITINGKHWRNVELFDDQIIHVPGVLGDSVLEVKQGRIHFIDSPCTQKICIHQGWLKRGGANATCLPNRVSVTIVSDDPDFDTINF